MTEERESPLEQPELDNYVRDALRRPVEAKRKRPRYPSEATRHKATFDIPRELHDEIRAIAKELEVPVRDVARLFLWRGVEGFRSGELEIDVGPDYERKRVVF